MQLNDRFAASDDVVAKQVGGETVLLDLASGQYFGLDLVGGRIWELFGEASQSLSSLSDAIEAEFDAPRSVIETDIRALLVDLKDRELIAPQPE
ncbi:PqqD family protein [Erythrobacter insulae]|uniref:PqqD family protein n=1 Tax=Erythrobacter insulae TaxID=2584124 RepID=A0A547PC99_9SPHN|nr:PqqD family protein [Erythrobacter insulae]TRD11654.1 PqqD family protein [Erythrobacter insulae]